MFGEMSMILLFWLEPMNFPESLIYIKTLIFNRMEQVFIFSQLYMMKQNMQQ